MQEYLRLCLYIYMHLSSSLVYSLEDKFNNKARHKSLIYTRERDIYIYIERERDTPLTEKVALPADEEIDDVLGFLTAFETKGPTVIQEASYIHIFGILLYVFPIQQPNEHNPTTVHPTSFSCVSKPSTALQTPA